VDYGEASKRAVEALANLGIESQANLLNRNLSGGTKRKVLVATVLSSDADIIFLDEPTTGLDPLSRQELWGFLSRLAMDRFLILTTHYLEEAERLADTIGILHRGKLIGLGPLDSLRSSVRFDYSVMVMTSADLPPVKDGVVTRGATGQAQILTNEAEAKEISRLLLDRGVKYTMSRTSLEDIFFHLVHGEGAEAE
jgi:ABC-2 type transport system ATP-binding protein